MTQFVNLTDLASRHALLTEIDGAHLLVVAIKATYDLLPDTPPRLADVQEPVMLSPRHIGDDAARTLLRDSELTLDHDGTDVIINASAHVPLGRATTTLGVSATVGTLQTRLQVTGDRLWKRSGGTVVPGDIAPFSRMPVIYERAFGGGHTVGQDAPAARDMRNPIGTGYCSQPERLIGTAVPNIEAPDALLTRAVAGAIVPVGGLAAQPAHWQQRKAFAGTYDAAWQKDRLPFWPLDLDARFFRCAAPGLQSDAPLQGHEQVTLVNLSPQGTLSFRLPRLVPTVRTMIHGEKTFQPVHLRRVIIEPDAQKLVLLWRAAVKCGPDGRIVQKITVDQRRIMRAGAVEAV